MLTFEDITERYKDITNDDTTANETLGKAMINETYHDICSFNNDFAFLEDIWTADTVADQQKYRLPHNYGRLQPKGVWIEVGSTKYFPDEVNSLERWGGLNAYSNTSDVQTDFFIYNDYLYLFPTPSTAGNTLYVWYTMAVKDMTQDNYTTGTVSINNDSDTVTGSGTTWTGLMEDQWIYFNDDGRWYEIDQQNSNTEVTLEKTYEGKDISSGNYKIGEMPVVPPGYHDLLWLKPVSIYYQQKGKEGKVELFEKLYQNKYAKLVANYRNKTHSQIVKREGGKKIVNPNNYPRNIG